MFKSKSEIAVGDWVVLESPVRARFCGQAWRVIRMSKAMTTLEGYQPEVQGVAREVERTRSVTLR